MGRRRAHDPCAYCGRKPPAATCPGCGRPKHDHDERLRNAVRRYWAGDTEALRVWDELERSARAQGSTSFADALMSAAREFTATYPVSDG